jgi:DNA mismatch endonuclease (patch repair protein)
MSRIRGRGNRSTERAMTALFRSNRITGWRRHPAYVFGRPDFYFSQLRTAIFIDGCFWHACSRCFKMPAQNRSFWEEKIRRNRRRDRLVARTLNAGGIRVLRLWEHDLERRTRRLSYLFSVLRARSAVLGA